MPPALCNKCRSGLQSEGDSWCLGCSAQEASWRLLQRRWNNPGLRAVAEESVLSAARLLRAFANLDSSLVTAAAVERHPATAAKARADRGRSRTPARDNRPPLPRTSPRQRSRERKSPEADYERDSTYGEESEEEAPAAEPAPAPAASRRSEVKQEEAPRRSEKPPEPADPPPSWRGEDKDKEKKKKRHHHQDGEYRQSHREGGSHKSKSHRPKRSNKKRKNKRGGAKHQRHYREVTNPFKASHRRLSSAHLQLASSFKEGFSRRA